MTRDYDAHYSMLSMVTYIPRYDITAWTTTNWYNMNAYGGYVEPSSAAWTGNWVLLSGGNNIRIPETNINYTGPPTINGVFSGTLSSVPIIGGVLAGVFPGTTVQTMNITPRANVNIPSLTDPQNGQYKTYPIFIEGSQNNVNAHFAGQEELANTELHVMLLNLTSISANIDLTNPSTIVNSINGLTYEELQSSEMDSANIMTDDSCHFYANSTLFPEMGDMKQGDYALMVWDYNLPNTPTLVGSTPIIVAKSAMDTVIQDAAPKPGDSITFTESQPNALQGDNYMYVVAMIPEANYTANVDVNTEGKVNGTIVTFQGLSLNEKVTIYTDGTSDGTTFYLDGMSRHQMLTKDDLKNTDFMEQLAEDELAQSNIAFAVKNTTATTGVDIVVPTTDTMPTGKYIVLSAAVDRNTGLLSAINQTTINLGYTWTYNLKQDGTYFSPVTCRDNAILSAFFPADVMSHIVVYGTMIIRQSITMVILYDTDRTITNSVII